MSNSNRSAGRISGVVVVLLVLAALGAGGYLAVRNLRPASGIRPVSGDSTSRGLDGSRDQAVEVYVVRTVDGESELVAETRRIPPRADRCKAALECLVKDAGSSLSAIPEGTRLLSLEIVDGLAEVNLSKEFIDNFSGGSEEESLAINAIVRTMAQFGNIKRVQILVDGQKVGTLGGHFELAEPLDVEVPPQKPGEVSE